MTYATIIYINIDGYFEDGTPDYRVLRWTCYSEEEFELAKKAIDEDKIIRINYY